MECKLGCDLALAYLPPHLSPLPPLTAPCRMARSVVHTPSFLSSLTFVHCSFSSHRPPSPLCSLLERGHLFQEASLISSPFFKAQLPPSNLPSEHLVFILIAAFTVLCSSLCHLSSDPFPLFLTTHILLTPFPEDEICASLTSEALT